VQLILTDARRKGKGLRPASAGNASRRRHDTASVQADGPTPASADRSGGRREHDRRRLCATFGRRSRARDRRGGNDVGRRSRAGRDSRDVLSERSPLRTQPVAGPRRTRRDGGPAATAAALRPTRPRSTLRAGRRPAPGNGAARSDDCFPPGNAVAGAPRTRRLTVRPNHCPTTGVWTGTHEPEKEASARSVRLALVAAVAVGATALIASSAAGEGSATASCQLVADPPFLYAVVIPVSSIQCDSPQRRLRVVTVLTRDGVEAASARRDCRNASVCYLDVDASAPDVAGNQIWCTHAIGYVNSRLIGEASACETDEF
jgi:hypothetical protein